MECAAIPAAAISDAPGLLIQAAHCFFVAWSSMNAHLDFQPALPLLMEILHCLEQKAGMHGSQKVLFE
jgi:hypothetical protein